MTEVKSRIFARRLNKNGFRYIRSKGDHDIYKNDKGVIIVITSPILNGAIARNLIKTHNLL